MKKDEFVGFHSDGELIKEIDDFAKSLGLNRSQAIRNLIASGLDDYRMAKRLGLISLVSLIRENRVSGKKIVDLVVDEGEKVS